MVNFTGSTTVDADPSAVFAYLSEVGNLPRYFTRMTSAEPGEGEEVRTTARMPDGREVRGTAWFRVDQEARRIEWGSEGPSDYSGRLQVRPAADGSQVEVHLHTTRVARGDREVPDGIRETLAALKKQVESASPASAGTPGQRTAAPGSRTGTSPAAEEARQVAGTARDAAAATAGTAGQVVRAPLAVTGQVLGELADSARRPDAVLYWGGLAGAALLGAIDWPVAVAIGVGVAVARGRRSAR